MGVGNALSGTKTTVSEPTRLPREMEESTSGGQVELSFEELDGGEDSDQDWEVVENEEELDSNVSSEGSTLSDDVPTEFSNLLDEPNWGELYKKCPRWREIWIHVNSPKAMWPPGYQYEEGKLFLDTLLCIPTTIEGAWILEEHAFSGHIGSDRLWKILKERYQWADYDRVKKLVPALIKNCVVCQACNRSTSFKARLRSFPIPPKIMSSVAIDLFFLPEVTFEGATFNTIVVCVDRHSGWTVAVPMESTGPDGEGITGARVAKLMLRHQWRLFGIPSLITCDRGAQFVGSWWRTLCAELGIRIAFAQAYHHQANGRAERAGQEIMERARKIQAQDRISWIEALPQILDRIHDTPGDTGLSPYEILFGRQRPLAGRPYHPPRVADDAKAFVEKMEETDRYIAEFSNWRNQKDTERINRDRKPFPRLSIDQIVWVQRPEGSGTKLDTRWIGPARVVEQKGANSYKVQIDEERFLEVPTKHLKLYQHDMDTPGQVIPLYWYKRTELE